MARNRSRSVSRLDPARWTATAAALREVDASLPGWLRSRMKDAVKPLVEEAKRKVRTLQVAGMSGSTGLRRRVARGVRLQAGVGKNPYLRVVTAMAESDEAIIPRGLDRERGWRHPVFGNTNVWVQQHPYESGWFTQTFADGRDDVQRALTDVLQEAADRIDVGA